jgi:hypothetical protein
MKKTTAGWQIAEWLWRGNRGAFHLTTHRHETKSLVAVKLRDGEA